MATVHGAGFMLIPALEPLQVGMGEHAHLHARPAAPSLWVASLAVAVHTLAMLITTGAVAIIVYEWVGLGFLRRGWINVDIAWNVALIGTGLLLVAT
jgi:hypothetical protein